MHVTVHAWRSENFVDSTLSFQLYVDSRNRRQISRFALADPSLRTPSISTLRPRDCDMSCLSPLMGLSSMNSQAISG